MHTLKYIVLVVGAMVKSVALTTVVGAVATVAEAKEMMVTG